MRGKSEYVLSGELHEPLIETGEAMTKRGPSRGRNWLAKLACVVKMQNQIGIPPYSFG